MWCGMWQIKWNKKKRKRTKQPKETTQTVLVWCCATSSYFVGLQNLPQVFSLVTVLVIAYNLHHFHPYQIIQRVLVPCGWGSRVIVEERNVSSLDKGDQPEELCIDFMSPKVNAPYSTRETLFFPPWICHPSVCHSIYILIAWSETYQMQKYV